MSFLDWLRPKPEKRLPAKQEAALRKTFTLAEGRVRDSIDQAREFLKTLQLDEVDAALADASGQAERLEATVRDDLPAGLRKDLNKHVADLEYDINDLKRRVTSKRKMVAKLSRT